MEEYIGMITLFTGNYAPQCYLFCHGQLLSINEYQALYSVLGTTYGGNGSTTFALPDFRSRVLVGAGQGNGLSSVVLGQQAGHSETTLSTIRVAPAKAATPMSAVATSVTHPNRQPYLGLHYIICVDGYYPSRSE
jgi:microcystin-dependent protein